MKEKDDVKKEGIMIDFGQFLKTFEGNPVYDVDENGKNNGPLTVKKFVASLLWGRKDDRSEINQAVLALKIFHATDPIVLKDEERVLIKNLVKSSASPGVRYQVECILDGKDPFEI